MKKFAWSLLLLFPLLVMVSGCGKPEVKSMAEGLEMSDIEAYEKAQQSMEADAMEEMDETE